MLLQQVPWIAGGSRRTILRHVKRRGLCTTATRRVTATPKPLEFNDSYSRTLGIEQSSSVSHEVIQDDSSHLSDDTHSSNSLNGTVFMSSLDPQSPRRNVDVHVYPRCLTSPNPTTFLVNSVSPATNGNSNYDTSSQPKSEYFGSPAQALSTHEVSIEDSFQIVSQSFWKIQAFKAQTTPLSRCQTPNPETINTRLFHSSYALGAINQELCVS